VAPVMHDTKIGKLLKIAGPIAMGGAMGGFGGNWRVPGSGFEASEGFWSRQAALAIAKRNADIQQRREAALEAWRMSQEERNLAESQRTREQTERLINPITKPPAAHWRQLTNYPGYELEEEGPEAGQVRRMQKPTDFEHPIPEQFGEPQKDVDTERRLTALEAAQAETKRHHGVEEKEAQERIDQPPKKTPSEARVEEEKAARKRHEGIANYALQKSGNDPDKAIAAINSIQSLSQSDKYEVSKLIRSQSKQQGKKRFTAEQLRSLTTPPTGP